MALRPVVITGVGVICAAGRDPEEFWARLKESEFSDVQDEIFPGF